MITDYLVDRSIEVIKAIFTGFGVIILVSAIAGAAVIIAAFLEMVHEWRKQR